MVNRDDHRSGLLCEPSSSALIKVEGRANLDRPCIEDGVLDKGEELFFVVWEDVGRD